MLLPISPSRTRAVELKARAAVPLNSTSQFSAEACANITDQGRDQANIGIDRRTECTGTHGFT